MQVLDKGVLVPGLHHDVVDVGFHVAAQLAPEARLHSMLEGSAGVPETERHPGVAVAALGSDEGRLLLILLRHHDLMVPGEGVQKTQELTPSRGIDDEVDPRQREWRVDPWGRPFSGL